RVAEKTMTADEALIALAEIARGDMSDFLEVSEGRRFATLDLGKAAQAGKLGLIKKFKNSPKLGQEIELYDRQSALQTILKAHGVFKDDEAAPVNVNI